MRSIQPVLGAKLAQDTTHMLLHGAGGAGEDHPDLPVSLAGHEPVQDLAFASAETMSAQGERIGLPHLFTEAQQHGAPELVGKDSYHQ